MLLPCLLVSVAAKSSVKADPCSLLSNLVLFFRTLSEFYLQDSQISQNTFEWDLYFLFSLAFMRKPLPASPSGNPQHLPLGTSLFWEWGATPVVSVAPRLGWEYPQLQPRPQGWPSACSGPGRH